ncbi:putative N-formylglutamate amidohydrolase [Tepidamorphus gemmatus]|uniref:Putative N-formylglutamate amidohydrolase n=1 Tax=Tepidamorphus gemmatus TaxID=747076 RepID=A0A4R3MKP0_9HYPH|nr:N-formylglutamate amidohydrolase [Tepidamorphus gemmatus]TCT13298.1 putative N-formylglutamate amidohydrolase [Tepidamorphus gemmatus]
MPQAVERRPDTAAQTAPTEPTLAYETIPGDPATGWLLVCDHASNWIPERYAGLGLPPEELERHIAYDIGAEGVTRRLAARLGAPAVMSRFSRLLIDPNRGDDDPTLVMRLSDGAVVPGNARIDAVERNYRIRTFYDPYHRAVTAAIDAALAAGHPPAIVSIHSFTPFWRGVRRPWEIGILWDEDPRLAVPMIELLRADRSLTVGDNEPYSGRLKGDTMYRHATLRGLAHALIEYRQDLIADAEGQAHWAARTAAVLERLAGREGLHDIRPRASAQ